MTHGAPAMDGWMLAFDTSTPATSIVCGRVGELAPRAAYVLEAGANQASERLVEHVVDTVRSAGASMSDIVAIAVGRGPGTFTGTRVALATAKGMALGLRLPLHPLSTLACVAASGPEEPSATHDGATTIVAVLDARKGEVYAATFVRHVGGVRHLATVEPVDEERCVSPQALLATLAEVSDVQIVGPGVRPYEAYWPSNWQLCPLDGPSPRGLWSVATVAVSSGASVAPSTVDATYLRASYAELGINVPKRSVWRNPALDERDA